MNDARKQLVKAYWQGKLLDATYTLSRQNRDNGDYLRSLLSELHNTRQIDLVDTYAFLTKPSQRHNFFLARRIFEETLPALHASVVQVMVCVRHLSLEARRDAAANIIFDPFAQFLAADTSRFSEALEAIRKWPDIFYGFVCPVLIRAAQYDFDTYFAFALDFTEHDNQKLRCNAIYALGAMAYPPHSTYQDRACATMVRISVKSQDDLDLAAVLRAASALAGQIPSLVPSLYTAIENALNKGGDRTYDAAMEELALHTNKLPISLLDLYISKLSSIRPENQGTVDLVDLGIYALLKAQHQERAIAALEAVLRAHRGALSLTALDSASHRLLTDDLPTFNTLMTRWFLDGDRRLCFGVTELINSAPEHPIPIELDPQQLSGMEPDLIVFLARKCIGYLFYRPTTMAHFVISLLRSTADDRATKHIEDLLFDPVLTNYPGEVRTFLESRLGQESPSIAESLTAALKRLDDYLGSLHNVGAIPELHPSLNQREAQRRRVNRQVSESYKQAMKGSLAELLTTKLVVLYGRSTINYMRGTTSEPTRVEIPMEKHSFEVPFPRKHNFDPFDLDYTLRILRAERIQPS